MTLEEIYKELDELAGLKDPEIVNSQGEPWIEAARLRAENYYWHTESSIIAGQILAALDELNWKQTNLAKELGVSPQAVNSYLSGQFNFTIKLRNRLEGVLGYQLGKYVYEYNQSFLVKKTLQTESKATNVSENPNGQIESPEGFVPKAGEKENYDKAA